MTKLKSVAIGCAALVAMLVLAVGSLVGFLSYKRAKYDKVVLPFLESYLQDLAAWEPARVAPYWAPEVEAQLGPQRVARLFLVYKQLGAARSHDRPEFRQVGAHTAVPYPEVVTYQVSAQYEAGPAELTFQLVELRSGELRVWFLHIESDAFLPQLEGAPDGSPPTSPHPAPGQRESLNGE